GGAGRHPDVRRRLRHRRAAGGRHRVSREARAQLRGVALKLRAVTVDFWGTLLLDPPSSDNRYKRRRMADFESLLAGMGVTATAGALDRAYDASAGWLGRVWAKNRDVPVTDHVRAVLVGVDGWVRE